MMNHNDKLLIKRVCQQTKRGFPQQWPPGPSVLIIMAALDVGLGHTLGWAVRPRVQGISQKAGKRRPVALSKGGLDRVTLLSPPPHVCEGKAAWFPY